MAQGNSEVGTSCLIVQHGATIVNPGRVNHSLLFKYCSNIGIINRLPQFAVQLLFPR